MVVDVEMEEAKKHVLELMKEKDKIENQLQEQKDILDTNHVGMEDTLVDSEGFPRADIDVYQVRHARSKIICLQNDHKALMKRIEEGLIKVHSVPGRDISNIPQISSAGSSYSTPSPMIIDEINSEPFLRVDIVSPGSPAELAGIQKNDLIMEFGSINSENFKTLKDIGDLVESSRYKPLVIKVKRADAGNIALTFIPRPWTGKGLLGCHVVPLESVER